MTAQLLMVPRDQFALFHGSHLKQKTRSRPPVGEQDRACSQFLAALPLYVVNYRLRRAF